MTITKSVTRPLSKSVRARDADWCYETDLDEAVALSGAWTLKGQVCTFKFKGKFVNAASSDRLCYNGSDVGANARVVINHSANTLTVQSTNLRSYVAIPLPANTIHANSDLDLTVTFNLTSRLISATINGYHVVVPDAETGEGDFTVSQITGGSDSNRFQGEIHSIEFLDDTPIQDRWITNGDEINGYISIPLVTSTDDFSYEFVWQRVDNTLESSDINRMLSYSSGGNAVNFNDSDRATSPNAVLIEIDSTSYFISAALQNVAQGSVNTYKVERVNGLVNFYIDGVKIGAGQNISGDFLIDSVMTNGTDYASGFLANLSINNERFYPIDEAPSTTEVIDEVSGQNGIRVNMNASNFEYVPTNSHKWNFGNIKKDSSILEPTLGDINITISSFEAGNVKPT